MVVKVIDKSILTAMFISSIDGKDPIERVQNQSNVDRIYINERIDKMIKNGLVREDRKTLTDLGRSSLRVVLTGGVFDIIHPGHIHTLRAAKRLGDVLVVVVATDNTAQKMKKRTPLHSQEQRKDLVESLKMVDLCLVGHEGDIFKTVAQVRPEVIALGYDQVHQEKFIMDGCKRLKIDVKVARLQSPLPEISSREIERKYGKAIHDI